MAKVDVVEWFNRFRKPLNKWFNKAGAGGDSEDLTQEVFIRLIRFSDTIDVEKSEPYVFTIAHNLAVERSERIRVCKPHSAEWLDDLVDSTDYQPDHLCMEDERRQELASLVNDLINKLPHRQSQVIKLFIYEGLTYKEIALTLGITFRTVLRDITKAYSQLRAWIGPILSEVIDRECAGERTDIDGNDGGGSESAPAVIRVRAKGI